MIRINEWDTWRIAFKTHYGLLESLVMTFGLTNPSPSFQEFINQTLQPFLDIFSMAFLDDLFIYSDLLKEHKECVQVVITSFKKAGL
jgi:hypothetical protein